MSKITNLSIIFLILIFLSCSYRNTKANEHTINARNKLKVYGFSHCLYKQFDKKRDVYTSTNIIFYDLVIAGDSYHNNRGTGMHVIKRDKDRYTTYDPYKETELYISKIYPSIKSKSKITGKSVVLLNCFEIYNSKEFDDFIKKQDKYIEPYKR